MDLIPAPRSLVRPAEPGSYPLTAASPLVGAPGTERVAAWLRAELGAATGFDLLPGAENAGGVLLSLDEALGAEAYRLVADAEGVRLSGGSAAGVFRGAQTLRQLLGPDAYRRGPLPQRDWSVPYVTI